MPDNNLFEIKKRITAAQQTRKITRTMELIASSRLQRGKKLLASCQEWVTHMREAARCLPDSYFAPLADPGHGSGKKAYIVFGGKKGLSGAYSPNLLQYAKPITDGHIVIAVGSAAEAFFADARTVPGDDIPSADDAGAIARMAGVLYESREADEVFLIFKRGAEYVTEPLYPPKRPGGYRDTVILEPSARVLLPALFEAYTESIVYEVQLQAFIAEQIARVAAMDSATRNADEIIADLQDSYNRIRQASITQEILMLGNAAKGEESQ